MIKVYYKDCVNVEIGTNFGIHTELNNYFKFQIPEWHFIKNNPKFWNWDGYVHLYNKKLKLLPYGLLHQLNLFCKDREYKLETDTKISKNENSLTKKTFDQFIKKIKINPKYKLRDYQEKSIALAINKKRLTCVSPTSSGKSLIAYCFLRWIIGKINGKVLLVVPNISLVEQMAYDFKDYGYEKECHKITAGVDKNSSKQIYISTWQSLKDLDKKYFEQFKGLVVDEAHAVKNTREAKCLNYIASQCTEAEYRLGLTGTLQDIQLNQLQIEALFGRIYQATTTKILMEKNEVAQFKVNSIILEYPRNITKIVEKLEWAKQQDFLETNENPRQNLIIELAKSLKENTLILFRKRTHGNYLYEKLVQDTTKEILYIDGTVKKEEREQIRQGMEHKKGVILVASYGTFSTGLNVRNLHYIIFASSSKSKIRVLQSIGRSLRLYKTKSIAILYDIVDWIGNFKNHYQKRMEYYIHEGFKYKEKRVNITKFEEITKWVI